MCGVGRGMKILSELRRNTRDQNSVIEVKNAFAGLISRLDTLRNESLSLRDISIEASKMKEQKEKRLKKIKISKSCGTTTKDEIYMQWDYQKEKKERNRINK